MLSRAVQGLRSRLSRFLVRPPPPEPPPSPEPPLHPGLRFVPAGHFYSPLPDVGAVLAEWDGISPVDPASLPGVDLREREQLRLLEGWDPFYREQPFGESRGGGLRYGFENGAYSYSDALFYHFMIRQFEPRRIVEIGSGHSSCVALDTSEQFLNGRVQLTCIEPYPELLKQLLLPGDLERIQLVPLRLQDAPLSLFAALESNDILFVDSTHVSKVGSDVNRIVFEILPRLAPGVLVHFHDIFYPFEYPRDWIAEGRAWNEAYVLRAFLQFNSSFEIVAFNTFLELRHRAMFEARFPLCLRNPGGSIWLRRTPVPAGTAGQPSWATEGPA
jgi:hypothetical protein